MTNKYIGILPYIYLTKPVEIGNISFMPVQLTNKEHWPKKEEDGRHLSNLLALFRDGLNQQIPAATYFIVDTNDREINEVHISIKKAVTILRFCLLA
ncbi:MAG: hypothetical protein ACYSR0_07565 [Planctomycetota bacterium]|jgi:hypothetical protein